MVTPSDKKRVAGQILKRVTDPLYLKLGSLSAEFSRIQYRFQNLSSKSHREQYESLRAENEEAQVLTDELAWWVKRVR
jgi:hypothetical protein